MTNKANISALLAQARQLMESNRFLEAVVALDQALLQDPNLSSAHINKAICLQAAGNVEGAIATLDKVLALSPAHGTALRMRGGLLQASGRLVEALDTYDKLTALDPSQAPVWVNKGVIHSQLEDPAKAVSCLEKALEILPDHPIALFNYGLAKLKLSRYQDAGDALRRFCAIAPRDYQKQIEHAEAMLNVIARTRVSSDRAEEWLGEADGFRAEGNWAKALEQYEKVLGANENVVEAWLGKGTCLNGLRRFDEAVKCYDRVLEAHPGDLQALIEKARSLDGATRYQEALSAIDEALNQAPHEAALLVQKGNTLGSLERHEEALQHFTHALQHDSENPAARFFKAIAEEKLGDKEAALLSFEEFSARAPALLRQQHAYAQERIAKLRGLPI